MQYVTTTFAQVYGACAYGGSTSQTGACATAASNSFGGTTATSGSPLSNTGFDILLIVTIACALAFAAMLVRFWRRPKQQVPTAKPPESPVS